jgi:bifunctional UDP-N-acetylglucosamine pyrophosphorylase/glucosamine-1-phosphate N-acetyltransferase
MNIPLHIIILAAGEGTRMKSRLPKVLHPVGGRPMLAHVLETAARLQPAGIHVVYNPDSPEVQQALAGFDVKWVPQAERLGTGHAVQQAMPDIPDEASVLVLCGDLPLVTAECLAPMIHGNGEGLRVLTMEPRDPAGYGRIQRDAAGRVTGIVEERDATETEKAINEVNSGIVRAPARKLRGWLEALRNDNSQGEYYLTDIVALAHEAGEEILGVRAADPGELLGANDRAQFADLEDGYRRREARRMMMAGVRIADPRRVDFRGSIEAGTDVCIDINVVLEGKNVLGDGVEIGPGCVLRDCALAAGTRVHPYSVLEGVRTHGACDIGPFARLRPGTELGEGSRVGNFVEVKNSSLGAGTKANHLSYLGDSTVGSKVNIGAGTITCNYDGVNKHRTVIEDGAFIGSDTQLVAPVTVGKDANIGAGSTITRDAPEGKLTISRAKQVTVPGWKRPTKGDSGKGKP